MRYFVEIKNTDGRYTGCYHAGNPVVAAELRDLNLGPEAEVAIKGQAYRLGELLQALIAYDRQSLEAVYDERGQLEIGQYLYRQIFGDRHPGEFAPGEDNAVEVRILTDDEHIARLPWVLLAHEGLFLCASGWSVSLGRTHEVRDAAVPPSPRILYVAPEPRGMETRATVHLQDLEDRLSPYDCHLVRGDHIRMAITWDQFLEALDEFKPHIVYYYGHGAGDPDRSRLVFATPVDHEPEERSVADFALALRGMKEPPVLAYINCCGGDAGGFLGAGWQLSECIPAVITNRTVARMDAAQAQALALWEGLLQDRQPPHVAMRQMLSKLAGRRLSLSDARWMAPVMHCHYGAWESSPPERVDPLECDPHWELRLDRVPQFSFVDSKTRAMLRDRRPRAWAYVWYGQKGRGVEAFHRRLKVELREALATYAHFQDVSPEWPMELDDPTASFEDMMCEAFGVGSMEEIPVKIRSYTQGASGGQTLVYVRHEPVHCPARPSLLRRRGRRQRTSFTQAMDPRSLEAHRAYLEWWDEAFVPLLPARAHAIVTLCFEVDRPAAFLQEMEERRLDDPELPATHYQLLDELEQIDERHLRDFLRNHKIHLTQEIRDREVPRILRRTRGDYVPTVSALRELMSKRLDVAGAAAT